MRSATNLRLKGVKVCKACNNSRTRNTPAGVDACPLCALDAEIEYQVWLDHLREIAENG